MVNRDLIEQFISLTQQINRLTGRKNFFCTQKIVPPLQMHALFYVKKFPKCTIGELAQNLHLSSSSVAQLVERLMESGYIKKITNPKDKRVTWLALSAKGKNIFAKMHKARLKEIEAIMAHVPIEDLKQIVRIFSELVGKLDAD